MVAGWGGIQVRGPRFRLKLGIWDLFVMFRGLEFRYSGFRLLV